MKHFVKKEKLDSGTNLMLINVPGSTSITLSVILRAGFYYSEPGRYEVPHILEHMCFDGTKSYNSKIKFAKEAEKFGAHINATTSPYFLRYYLVGSRVELENAVKVVVSQVFEPLLMESDFKSEVEVIKNEINRKNENEDFLVGAINGNKIVPKKLLPCDRIEQLKDISLTNVKDFHKFNFVTSNAYIIVSGDIDSEAQKKLIHLFNNNLSRFASGKKNDLSKPQIGKYKKVISHKNKKTNQSFYSMVFVKEDFDKADIKKINILNTIYNRGLSSRLFNEIRQKGISYSPSSGFTVDNDFSDFFIEDSIDIEKTIAAFDLSLKVLVDLVNGDFTEKNLNDAKNYIKGSVYRNNETPEQLAWWYGADFARDEQTETLEDYLKELNLINKNQVLKIAKEYINKDNWTLALLGPKASDYKKDFQKVIDKYLT
jgi:zinc protease